MSMLSRLGQRITAASARAPRTFARGMVSARSFARDYVFTKASAGFVAGAVTFMPMLTGEDFFEHKFVVNSSKKADDIIDFYSTEDFLQILGIFPFAIHFVISGVQWDTEKENTMTVHNAMEISFTLEEREEETASGEKVVAFFQKRERFKNFIPFTRFLMWDQVQCYGYNRREDGTIEIFHRGENFYGPFPVRVLVQLHAYYVIWATQKHINSPAFGVAGIEDQEHQRSNIPVHALKDFVRRLQLAQQVAIESSKLVAGTSTEDAEKTLKKLQRLRESPTMAYVNTVKKAHLNRRPTSLEIHDPEAQEAIDSAMQSLSRTKEGQAAAAAAVEQLMVSTVQASEPRYGGAFKGKKIAN